MNNDFWSQIENALDARARASAFNPNAYPITGTHASCDHSNDYCTQTLTNNFVKGN